MGAHVKSYVFTHLKYWDLYLALAVTTYVALILYIAFMWGMGDFYVEGSKLPVTEKASAFMKPIATLGAVLSLLFVFANVSVIKRQQLESTTHNILVFILYQFLSFIYLFGVGLILFLVIRKYLFV